jgi:hypothetical protein
MNLIFNNRIKHRISHRILWYIIAVISLLSIESSADEKYLPYTALYTLSIDGEVTTEITTNHNIIDIDIDPHDNQRLVALSVNSNYLEIIESIDNGKNWKSITIIQEVPNRDFDTYRLHLSQGSPTIFIFGRYLYRLSNNIVSKSDLEYVNTMASSQSSGQILLSSRTSFFNYSSDDGITWSRISNKSFKSILWLPKESSVIIGGTYDTVEISHDKGKNWVKSKDFFGKSDFGSHLITDLTVGKTSTYAISGIGCFESKDNGINWEPLMKFKRWAIWSSMAVLSGQDSMIIVSRYSDINITQDHGENWKNIKSLKYDVAKIIIDPRKPMQVYVLCVSWPDV